MKKVSIFDFDGTIYSGDCTVEFAFFVMRKKFKTIIYFPIQLFFAPFYFLKLMSEQKYKEIYFKFLNILTFQEIEKLVKEFWIAKKKRMNMEVVNAFNSDQKKGNITILATASPEILFKPILEMFAFDYFVGTKLKTVNGKIYSNINGKNCKGKEKINRIKEFIDIDSKEYFCENSYSDSFADLPILKLAKNAYFVKKDGSMNKIEV